ncbi:MAG: rRNA maturation RNase YbeY [Chitinophagaceae bacterium]
MPSKSKVCFFYTYKSFSLKDRGPLKQFIEGIFKKEGKKLLSLNYVFCTDKQLLEINRRFLNHNFYTDIITFDLSESKMTQAEIHISIDRVRDNAGKLGISFNRELHRVIFHGVLHLCGFSDKTKVETAKMRAREDHYLLSYFGPPRISRGTFTR